MAVDPGQYYNSQSPSSSPLWGTGAGTFLSNLGYRFGLGGMGISEAPGIQYNPSIQPSQSGVATYTGDVGGTTGPTGYGTGYTEPTVLGNNITTTKVANPGTAGTGQNVNTGGGGGDPTSQIQSELDAIYNPVFSALQGQENTLNQNYSTVPGEIGTQYANSSATLAQQNKEGVQGATAQETQAGQTKTDALTGATRLYNELSRGGQQRFGGASSAGEAFGALTAVEQQRRQGTIQQAYSNAMQQIGTYKQNLQDKFTLAMKDLTAQKDSALIQARRDFQDALQQIQNNRAQAQTDKATATMNVLQDLRNKVYTVNQQSLQFAQQLAANNQISLKAVDDYSAKVAASLGSMQTVGTNFGTGAMAAAGTTSLGIGSFGGNTTQPLQTGQIQQPGKKYDRYGNEIPSLKT